MPIFPLFAVDAIIYLLFKKAKYYYTKEETLSKHNRLHRLISQNVLNEFYTKSNAVGDNSCVCLFEVAFMSYSARQR